MFRVQRISIVFFLRFIFSGRLCVCTAAEETFKRVRAHALLITCRPYCFIALTVTTLLLNLAWIKTSSSWSLASRRRSSFMKNNQLLQNKSAAKHSWEKYVGDVEVIIKSIQYYKMTCWRAKLVTWCDKTSSLLVIKKKGKVSGVCIGLHHRIS